MASGGGKLSIGRFFVTSSAGQQDDTEHKTRKGHRAKKYGMPVSYPEPTIQEETSPGDFEESLSLPPGTTKSQLLAVATPEDASAPAGSDQTGIRPRSGTWSSTRRVKIKAEKDEGARVRHKSGDAILPVSATSRWMELGDTQGGNFEPIRPRSKSDAKAILAARQRRKSGDDILSDTTGLTKYAGKESEKKGKKDGFFESLRPRSKSDAARLAHKKPNIMTTMKNAVQTWNEDKDRRRHEKDTLRRERQLMLGRFSQSCQHTLVSPGNTIHKSSGSGRRSGESTPVDQLQPPNPDVYHTWHAGAQPPNVPWRNRGADSGRSTPISKVMDLFRPHRNETAEERQRRKSGNKLSAQLQRRLSGEQEKRRHGSGSFGSSSYIKGDMDPTEAAKFFRNSRGLPAADPFLENIRRSDLEGDETQIFVKFFKYHQTYDLIPISAKLVVFDTRLQVKKAFYALVYNGVRAAPVWDAARQCFVGMLTITDFIRILQNFYHSPNRKMEELEEHRLETWRTVLNDESRPLISIRPHESLYVAIRSLIHHHIHRLPVIDPSTGNVLYIITHKRILKFLYLYINELPKPSVLSKPLRELQIGTYDNIETAREDTLIIEALNKFVQHRISALPIIDDGGKLIDIYAKFDVINLAAEGTYNNLDVTLRKANEYRNEWFEQVHRCTLDEGLGTIMERIVRAEVHRLVVVDAEDKVIGIVSLSDILQALVLRPCDDLEMKSLMDSLTVADIDPHLSPGTTIDISGPAEDVTASDVIQESMTKTCSDESVADGKWSSDDRLSGRSESSSSGGGTGGDGEEKREPFISSVGVGDSEEDEGRGSMADTKGILPSQTMMTQSEVIPITG